MSVLFRWSHNFIHWTRSHWIHGELFYLCGLVASQFAAHTEKMSNFCNRWNLTFRKSYSACRLLWWLWGGLKFDLVFSFGEKLWTCICSCSSMTYFFANWWLYWQEPLEDGGENIETKKQKRKNKKKNAMGKNKKHKVWFLFICLISIVSLYSPLYIWTVAFAYSFSCFCYSHWRTLEIQYSNSVKQSWNCDCWPKIYWRLYEL